MVVEKGYKQTEIGVIPEDWEVIKLSQNFNLKARIGWQGLTTKEYLESGDYSLVTGTDFKNGYINWDKCVFVEKIRFDQDKNIQIKIGDVLVTKDGTIGKVAYINYIPNPTTLNSGVFVVRPITNRIDNRFFYYVLMSFYFDSYLSKITAGSTITHLYQKDFVHFSLILPPLHEQTAIANALSDMDALIAQTEKLIVKKKAIKQGVMQELLKPKEGWVTKKLGDCCQLITKGTTPTSIGMDFKDSGVNFLKIESLSGDGKIILNKVAFIDTKTNELLKRSQIKAGDILFSIAGFLGRIALVNENIIPANTNQALAIIRLKNDSLLQKNYLFWYLNHSIIQNHINTISVQGAQANLSLQNIADFEILIPSPKTQIDISEFLNDIEESIQTITTKLQKLKNQKQGMMQALLTGKIRLV
jgi:type I restriction enzyme S subunit